VSEGARTCTKVPCGPTWKSAWPTSTATISTVRGIHRPGRLSTSASSQRTTTPSPTPSTRNRSRTSASSTKCPRGETSTAVRCARTVAPLPGAQSKRRRTVEGPGPASARGLAAHAESPRRTRRRRRFIRPSLRPKTSGSQVFRQRLHREAEGDEPAERVEPPPQQAAEGATGPQAREREGRRRRTDEEDRGEQRCLEHGQHHARREGVHARGQRQAEEDPPRERTGTDLLRLARLVDHFETESREQADGDPVIPSHDERSQRDAEEIPQKRHGEQEAAEHRRHPKRVAPRDARHREPLDRGDRSAIH